VNLPVGSITSGAIADGTIATADLANQAVTNAKLGTDTARFNHAINGGFERWQRGNGPFSGASNLPGPDRWTVTAGSGSTLSVSRDTTTVATGSGASAAFTYTHVAESFLYQTLEDVLQLRGRTLSVSVAIRANAANAVRLSLYWNNPTLVNNFSSFHSGGGAFEVLTVTATVPAGATQVGVEVVFDATCGGNVDNCMVVIGNVAADYAPLALPDDVARCLRYYEKFDDDGGGNAQVMGIATAAGQIMDLVWAFRALKAVTPTVTVVGSWSTTNCSIGAPFGITKSAARTRGTSAAAGNFFGNNINAGANLVAEANI
jgi:hypothetical protein